jgi:hypothetical protein
MSMDPDKDTLALPAEAKLGGPKMPSAPPCYSDAGWLQRPDDGAYSFQYMRGLWERHERIFAIRRIDRDQAAAGERVWMAGVAHSAMMPKCPSLMTIGQRDYIAVENAIDVHESCKRSGAPLALKVLSTEETEASPGHIDNPTQEFVFDWLRQNSTRPNAVAASVEDACDCAGA